MLAKKSTSISSTCRGPRNGKKRCPLLFPERHSKLQNERPWGRLGGEPREEVRRGGPSQRLGSPPAL
eukprot:7772673-Pyramimonas_sp.AAC.1